MRAIVLIALMTIAAGNTYAQDTSATGTFRRVGPTKPSKVVSKTRQPVGTPHKVSSFAPRHTNKRVYGDPIQAPIVHTAPAPKKPAPK